MKIGMMVDMYKPYISGVTNHVDICTEALEQMGHDVTIFTFGDRSKNSCDEKIVHSIGFPVKMPFADLIFYLSVNHSKQAIQQIKSMDIINVHHPFMSGNLAYRYCREKKIPIIFTSHTKYDLLPEIYMPFIPRSIIRRVVKHNLQKSCNKFNAVITPSKSSRLMYEDLGVKANYVYVPNGIKFPITDFIDKNLKRKSLGYSNNDFIFIYVGRISPEKNLPLLIDTFYHFSKLGFDAKLLIVGKGTELNKIQNKVNKLGMAHLVKFTGFIPYDEVYDFLRIADVFLTLSVTEVHPLSVLEAMCAGLPVIGINAPGINDLVEDKYTGLLSTLDIDEIVANLKYMIDFPDQRISYGENAKKTSEMYNINHTSRLLVEVFDSFIGKSATYDKV